MKTFEAEAGGQFGFLCRDFGFLGPEFDGHGGGYPVVLSVRYHRPMALVEVCLVLAYGGEEYVATSMAIDHEDGPLQRIEIGSNTARTGFQMRRALGRQAISVRQALTARSSL